MKHPHSFCKGQLLIEVRDASNEEQQLVSSVLFHFMSHFFPKLSPWSKLFNFISQDEKKGYDRDIDERISMVSIP